MPLNNFGCFSLRGFRCAQPDERGIFDLQLIGVETILKLNEENPEEEQWCKDAGVVLVSYPMTTFNNTAVIVREAAAKLQSLSGGCCVHCERGRDRTGLVIAAWEILYNHKSLEQAQADRRMFGVTAFIEAVDNIGHMDEILTEIAAP